MKKFLPTVEYVDKMPQHVLDSLRNAHLYSNLGGAYNFQTKHIYIKRCSIKRQLLLHELGHWLIAIFTHSHKIHAWYDSFHLKKTKRNIAMKMKDSPKRCKDCKRKNTVILSIQKGRPDRYVPCGEHKDACCRFIPNRRTKALNLLKALLHGLCAVIMPGRYEDIIKLNKEQNHGT